MSALRSTEYQIFLFLIREIFWISEEKSGLAVVQTALKIMIQVRLCVLKLVWK